MTKEELLNLLIESIRNTTIDYYRRSDNSLLERPFCYELYHQFRLLQREKGALMLSGEPSKTLSCPINGGEYPASDIDKDHVYPDFILHKGLSDTDPENQIMAIEVKQKGNIDKDKLESDIKKLQRMVSSLAFNFGVFIAIGMTNTELRDELKKTDKNIYQKPDKIHFIATKSINDNKKYFSYSDIPWEK